MYTCPWRYWRLFYHILSHVLIFFFHKTETAQANAFTGVPFVLFAGSMDILQQAAHLDVLRAEYDGVV